MLTPPEHHTEYCLTVDHKDDPARPANETGRLQCSRSGQSKAQQFLLIRGLVFLAVAQGTKETPRLNRQGIRPYVAMLGAIGGKMNDSGTLHLHAQLLHQGLEELIRVQGGRGRGLLRNTVQKKALLTPVTRRAKAFSKLRRAPACPSKMGSRGSSQPTEAIPPGVGYLKVATCIEVPAVVACPHSRESDAAHLRGHCTVKAIKQEVEGPIRCGKAQTGGETLLSTMLAAANSPGFGHLGLPEVLPKPLEEHPKTITARVHRPPAASTV